MPTLVKSELPLRKGMEMQPMMQSRWFRGGAALVLLGFATLTTLGSAQQPGKGQKLPDSVKLEANIPYAGTDNPRQCLNLLLPKTPRDGRPLPVIAHIHGGAWLGGSREGGHGRLARYVADGEYAAVAIGYRLTGEAIWPAQIHDCKAAIRWIRANARKYNLDPDKIGVVGESAGGHLVAMLGTSGGVEALEGDLGPHKGVSSRVQCVVDQFGPSDIPAMKDYPSSLNHDAATSPEGKLVGGRVSDKKDVAIAASPVTYASSDDPPFLIIHGNKDMVVPYNQSERMYAALKKVKVECYFVTVDGGGHGGFRNPEVQKRERQFFDKHLRGVKATISEESIPNDAPKKAQGKRVD
jgi:acetyl esterase/lipase